MACNGAPVYAEQAGYWANGQEKSVTYGNTVKEETAINGLAQIAGRKATKGAGPTPLWQIELTYPASTNNGNPATQTMQLGSAAAVTQNYYYDPLNRLQSVIDGGLGTQTFAYDRWGNRALVEGSYKPLSDYVEVPANADAAVLAASVAAKFPGNQAMGGNPDSAGNMRLVHSRTLHYDGEGHVDLVTAALAGPATETWRYDYDGEGRRVRLVHDRTEASVTTVLDEVDYVYDAGGQLLAEYAIKGDMVAAEGLQYLTTDWLGSTRLVTKADGTVGSTHDYLPFGEEVRGTGAGPRVKFTGKEREDYANAKLDYFGARYLSGVQGRFTSPDEPLVDQDQSNPDSWNLFSYVRSNPVRHVDLDGRRVRICINGGVCFEVDDENYSDLQPGNPGVVLPTFGFGRDSLSIKTITCGGQNCGTATYVNDDQGLQGVLNPIWDFREQIAPLNPKSWTGTIKSGTIKTAVAGARTSRPRIKMDSQGKHIPGHRNFLPGRSEFTHADPQGLLDGFAGKGRSVGSVGNQREAVDFGETIGTYVSKQGQRMTTTRGVIHYDQSGGAHIVPARPTGN